MIYFIMHNAARQKGRLIVMKSILKTLLGLAAASVAATAVLSFTAFAAVESANSTKEEEGFTWDKVTKMWQGRFYNQDVAKFDKEFYDPISFRFHVKGDTLTLKSEAPYVGNFITAVITLNSASGVTSESTPKDYHNKKETTVSAKHSGTITLGRYFGFMYDGSDISDGMLERAAVYVSNSDYMP